MNVLVVDRRRDRRGRIFEALDREGVPVDVIDIPPRENVLGRGTAVADLSKEEAREWFSRSASWQRPLMAATHLLIHQSEPWDLLWKARSQCPDTGNRQCQIVFYAGETIGHVDLAARLRELRASGNSLVEEPMIISWAVRTGAEVDWVNTIKLWHPVAQPLEVLVGLGVVCRVYLLLGELLISGAPDVPDECPDEVRQAMANYAPGFDERSWQETRESLAAIVKSAASLPSGSATGPAAETVEGYIKELLRVMNKKDVCQGDVQGVLNRIVDV